MKTRERALARELRSTRGLPIKEIAAAVGASSSSVSRWVRDVPLTIEQRQRLVLRNPRFNSQLNGSAALVIRSRERRRSYQHEGRQRARREDATYAAGCMLYWAEGAKARNSLRFTNSDPEMVRFFLEFLRRYFAVADAAVRVTCNLYADHASRQREIEQFWLDLLGLPGSSLCKSTVNTYSRRSSRKRINLLPHGTCRLVVNETRLVQVIFGSIQAIGGLERDSWLD